MRLISKLIEFLRQNCSAEDPLLLALSGGADSLCLFFGLLEYRKQTGKLFHIAHIDHGWRVESCEEAESLRKLAEQNGIPFHLKVLHPSELSGNLEDACRKERYSFFADLTRMHHFQAVLTGHHQDDQTETIFKRICEGAHWSRWKSLKFENKLYGMRILRPFLNAPKAEIKQALIDISSSEIYSGLSFSHFEDSSNTDRKYLRPRLRQDIFPWLNASFGKKIESSLLAVASEMEEMTHYFEAKLAPLLKYSIPGPWGIFLDLQQLLPTNLLEIKFLLRLLSAQHAFFLSRTIIDQAAVALLDGKANRVFEMGGRLLWVDRKRLFLVDQFVKTDQSFIQIERGIHQLGGWTVVIEEGLYSPDFLCTTWKEGWQGHLHVCLPKLPLFLGFSPFLNKWAANSETIRKKWSQAKVPAQLYELFPLVWENSISGKKIFHEFMTGTVIEKLKEGGPCLNIQIKKRNG